MYGFLSAQMHFLIVIFSFSESSSSDGENAGEVKNVARLVMRPPGHSGKAKKGHLVFDASFEGGKLTHIQLSFCKFSADI